MSARLQILVSTLGQDGLQRLSQCRLPRVDDVEYLVSCQNPDGPVHVPAALERPDLRVVLTPTRGLSINRNHALDIATSPYVLIADDDLDFDADGLTAVIAAFDADPELAVATFRHNGEHSKVYPPDGHDLSRRFRNYSVVSFEIALRREAINAAGIRFSPLMGIGATFATQGEEEVFVLSAMRAGLRGRFFDVTIATHYGPTTGYRNFGPGAMHARGIFAAKLYGTPGAIIHAPVIAWRHRHRTSMLRALYQILAGIRYARRVR